jgi:hypothetical protein
MNALENYLAIERYKITKTIQATQQKLTKLNRFPTLNRKRINQVQKIIHAQEGHRDILTSSITQSQNIGKVVDKNNYPTYASQVSGVYDMYNNKSDYGGEMCRGVIDTRVSFIGGEGINVTANKPATKKYIEKWLRLNKLHGSKLITMIQTGEMEGKNLVLLQKASKKDFGRDEDYINASSFAWWANNYTIKTNPFNTDEIQKITYTPKSDSSGEKTINHQRAVYVKLGGSEESINETTNRVHCVLTDIENYSRGKYDLRKNTHLFGKTAPTWKTESMAEAKSIKNNIEDKSYDIGDGYAGTAEMRLLEPSGGAALQSKEDILISLKTISSTTAIPIHWLAWPELMSNRATAENLLEVVKAGTVKERLIWQEALTEMISKSMTMAVEAGYEKNNIFGEFKVTLPFLSFATLKAIQETWIPLWQQKIISLADLRNRVPGIDPLETDKQLKIEQKQSAQDSPINNETAKKILEDEQNEQNKDSNED